MKITSKQIWMIFREENELSLSIKALSIILVGKDYDYGSLNTRISVIVGHFSTSTI